MQKKWMSYVKYIIPIMGIGLFLLYFFVFPKEKEETETEEISFMQEEKEETKTFSFDIKGAVNSPGVYQLEKGARIVDAISKANGLREDADTSFINLSKEVANEMVIIIYTKGEIEKMGNAESAVKYVDKECICPNIKNDGCVGENKVTNAKEKKEETSSIIHINTASEKDLMELPGIGEAKAKAIITHREKTPFTKIEDIQNVKGIGPSIYEKIKPFIAL